ncbi:hypothetical protein INT47_007129 [Mucor saturninus]|uniref:Methyltransferase domain-containing protein n=1 Tax=Mucor saturninus TaxID=64648 RepID=A0A8H7QTM0_9FUNG|nr:hypothetical protein INT47_007129 [Mucor saturninus]
MGNQTSRLDRSSSSATINDDPCLDNMRQWHTNKKDEPYKRQYPLPTIANDHNRIKPRKQSSPAAVTSLNINHRKAFSRFFNRHNKNSLPRNNSCIDTSTPSTAAAATTSIPNNTLNLTSTNNNNNSPNNTNTNSSSSSFNSQQPHYIHPLAPPSIKSIEKRPCQQLPYDNESFSRQSLDMSSRRLTNSNRNSLNYTQLKLLTQQQQVNSYKLQGKRKYHQVTGSNYLLPCDDEEIDRLHLQHFMIRFAIQGNYLAPVSEVLRKGGRVLDVGCGPGSWAMEIAGEYPKSTVIGVDITPIYPKEIKPTNCAFYQCNILNPLPFEDNTFDYVFMRFMGQGVESDKWSNILAELIRILKPNGWIEWVEGDVEIHRPGPSTHEFNEQLIHLMKENDQDPHIGRTLKERLLNTGELMQVSSMFVSCPGGQWAGKLGQLTMQSWKAYYQALRPLLSESWGISTSEYHERLQTCWREADEYKTFENVHFSYAQKRPLSTSCASSVKFGP